MTRLEEIVKLCSDQHVLDIGCYGDRTGYGHPLWLHGEIRDVAADATGIDINKSGIKELQDDGYEAYYEDAEDFELDERFNVVVAAEVIEHLTNPAGFLNSVEKHLTEDGVLIVTTPNLHSLLILGAYLSPVYHEEEHSIGFTPKILENLFERCGWSVDELKLVTHEDIPRRGNKIVNLLVPRRLNFTIFCQASPNR